MNADRIGMSEKTWLRHTLVADMAGMEGDERVWKSNGAFYHFKSGRLARVTQGVQRHEVMLTGARER